MNEHAHRIAALAESIPCGDAANCFARSLLYGTAALLESGEAVDLYMLCAMQRPMLDRLGERFAILAEAEQVLADASQ